MHSEIAEGVRLLFWSGSSKEPMRNVTPYNGDRRLRTANSESSVSISV